MACEYDVRTANVGSQLFHIHRAGYDADHERKAALAPKAHGLPMRKIVLEDHGWRALLGTIAAPGVAIDP